MVKQFNKTLVICGIVRDAEKGLKKNVPIMKQLVTFFEDYFVIIFENDSKDATKVLLKEWADDDPRHVYVFVENRGQLRPTPQVCSVKCNPFFSRGRISKMVDLRNQYMEKMEQLNVNADFLLVVDLDVAQLSLSSILSSFESEKEWDAVTAFGYSTSPKLKRRFHDTYALTEFGDEKNPQTETKIKELAEKYGNLKPGDDWVRVSSAFGGLAIYKFAAIKGLRYQLLDNDDDRVEVRCEHFSICKQMADRGCNRIYINPAMILKYQNLTWSVFVKSLKRRFGR